MKMKSLSFCLVVLALLCWAGAAWSAEPVSTQAPTVSLPAWLTAAPAAVTSPAPADDGLLSILAPLNAPQPVCTCTPTQAQCTQTCIIQGGTRCIGHYSCLGCTGHCLCNGTGCL
jgi:hypothetical protein